LGDPVDAEIKAQRLQRVFASSDRLLGAHLAGLVGSVQQVLVEGPSKHRPENPSGRSRQNEIVHIIDATGSPVVGRIVDVEIVEALGHSLLGRMTVADSGASTAAADAGMPGGSHGAGGVQSAL
jgi:tRNA-2-methylthio-N6-dimethylallyladenosine synthase